MTNAPSSFHRISPVTIPIFPALLTCSNPSRKPSPHGYLHRAQRSDPSPEIPFLGVWRERELDEDGPNRPPLGPHLLPGFVLLCIAWAQLTCSILLLAATWLRWPGTSCTEGVPSRRWWTIAVRSGRKMTKLCTLCGYSGTAGCSFDGVFFTFFRADRWAIFNW